MTYDILILITNIIIIAYGALVGALIYYSVKNQYMGDNTINLLKTLLGIAVLCVSVISWYLLRNFTVRADIYMYAQIGVIIAIALSFIGEYFNYNIGIDERRFKVCLTFNLISYILFIAVECLIYRVWYLEAIIAAILVVILQFTVNRTAYVPDAASKRVYFADTVAVSFLLAKSVAVVIKEKSYNTLFFMIGAALLFLNYIYIRLWGGAADRENCANAGTIVFYAGLIMTALSISPEYLDFFAF